MHPTLLPKHRGRAAIPWAILSGIAVTGVTLFEIVDGTADSGPIVGQVEVPLSCDETATSLYDKVTAAHVELVRRCVPQLLDGTAPRVEQETRRASVWPKRMPADGIIDWETRAPYLHDWVRAQTRPYPGAFTYLGDEKLVIWRARPVELDEDAPAGTVVSRDGDDAVVACGEGGLVLEEVEGVAEVPVGAQLG
jgi:methionyl-tRNA formyltransferase